MLYVLIGLGLLFIGLGFVLTEGNAKYLLSGYNTMSEAEREKVDLKGFIPFYKNFHIFLGISVLGFGLLLNYLIGKNASGIFIGVYPILAYIYFIWKSTAYFKGTSSKNNKIGMAVLGLALVFVLGLMGMGFKEDQLLISSEKIELQGSYGEELLPSAIQSISLVDQLPAIRLKKNGFALGSIRKGYFKTSEGETVKLILNSDQKPCLFILKKDGQKIYYSAKRASNEAMFETLSGAFPGLEKN